MQQACQGKNSKNHEIASIAFDNNVTNCDLQGLISVYIDLSGAVNEQNALCVRGGAFDNCYRQQK